MEDYELGKLAEELIKSRYSDKIKNFEKTIECLTKHNHDLRNELSEEKEKKGYYKEIITDSMYGCNKHFEYIPIDDVTKELRESKKLSKNLDEKLGIVAKVNIKLDRFIHRNKLSTYLYKKWLIKE